MTDEKKLILIKLTLLGHMIGYIVVGSLFYFAPEGTIDVMNSIGAKLSGSLVAAEMGDLYIWLSLTTGYMVMVSALTYLAWREPFTHRICISITAIGKATSSITCLIYFITAGPVFFYLLNFVVDGSIAVTYIALNLMLKKMTPGA